MCIRSQGAEGRLKCERDPEVDSLCEDEILVVRNINVTGKILDMTRCRRL